jgi:hypothetical protein
MYSSLGDAFCFMVSLEGILQIVRSRCYFGRVLYPRSP